MNPARARLVVGNWKMHGRRSDLEEVRAVVVALVERPVASQVVICPPATLVHSVARLVAATPIAVGAQTCHSEQTGAHTGEISAEMLRDAGASFVILGHSERRAEFGETSAAVAQRARAAIQAGLFPIICIGETGEERAAGRTDAVLTDQVLASSTGLPPGRFGLAYEPIWAIGSGRIPDPPMIREAHAAVRDALATRRKDAAWRTPILYGGSVNAQNAGSIAGLEGVDGLLVGRASLRAADFLPIIRSASAPASGRPLAAGASLSEHDLSQCEPQREPAAANADRAGAPRAQQPRSDAAPGR